jgi:hypothetical protein
MATAEPGHSTSPAVHHWAQRASNVAASAVHLYGPLTRRFPLPPASCSSSSGGPAPTSATRRRCCGICSWPDGADRRQELIDLEHRNDAATHDIVHLLHARAAVSFERRDVLALASGLDDIVDHAEEAADFLILNRVEAPTDQAIELADTPTVAGTEVAGALDHMDEPWGAREHLDEIKRLDHDGDRILSEGMTACSTAGSTRW